MSNNNNGLADAKDDFFQGRYEDAAGWLRSYIAGMPDTDWGAKETEAWLFLVACHVLRDNTKEAEILVELRSLKPGSQAIRSARLGDKILAAFKNHDPIELRIGVERCSQGWNDYSSSDYPQFFEALEKEIAKISGNNVRPPHDYSTTSFLQWKGGLAAMGNGNFRVALPMLLNSIERYALGGMGPDALWSWFDAITCLLLMEDLAGAKKLYETNASVPVSDPHFVELADLVIKGCENGDPSIVAHARRCFAEDFGEYSDSEYPGIFDLLETKAHAFQIKEAGPPSTTTASAGTSRAAAGGDTFRFLVARPVREDNLPSLLAIHDKRAGKKDAKDDVASMRKELIPFLITRAVNTLRPDGGIPWSQGLLCLVAEYYPAADKEGKYPPPGTGAPVVAARASVQLGWGGYWRKSVFRRSFDPTFQKLVIAEPEFLVYESNSLVALEFAGIETDPDYERRGIGWFLTQSRALFVLLHLEQLQEQVEGKKIGYLYANLLTADKEGKYPFYELVVKTLFGDLDYDTADLCRYQRMGIVSRILEEFLKAKDGRPSPHIALHLLPADIKANLGLVRQETLGAKKNLEKFMFKPVNKYDILDGGQYYEIRPQELSRRAQRYTFIARKVKAVPETAPYLTFAPDRKEMADFVCARARAVVEGDYVQISEDVYNILEIQRDEQVVALVEPDAKKGAQA